MANQPARYQSFVINNLRDAGYSECRIAQTLGASRGAVRRHWRAPQLNSIKAPTAYRVQALVPQPIVATITVGRPVTRADLDDLLPDRWLESHPRHAWSITTVRRKERKAKEKNRRQKRRP